MEQIISILRTGVYYGEAQKVVFCLCRAGDSRILEVIGETEYPSSSLVKNETPSPNSIRETPRPLLPTHIKTRHPTGDLPTVEQQINSIQACLGEYETPLLTITRTYHTSTAATTPARPSLFPEQ